MKIEKDLPFDICESCDECILDVDEQILISDEGVCDRVVFVGCRNSEICKKLKEKHHADKG